jgi:hypothetical protein
MDRENAINYLQSSGFSEEQITAIEQAFNGEPCGDAIHNEREQAYMRGYEDGSRKYRTDVSTEKTGRWEWVQYDSNPNIGNWHCSECNRIVCGAITEANPAYAYKYCPECGAKMGEDGDKD